MKKLFKKLLYMHFFILIKILFFLKKPYVVLVLGDDNSPFIAQFLIDEAVRQGLVVRKDQKFYNSRFGSALTVLNLPSADNHIYKRIWIYFLSWIRFLVGIFSFPKYFFLEAGIMNLGDSKEFISLLKPKVIVFSLMSKPSKDDLEYIILDKEINNMISYINLKSKFSERINSISDITGLISLVSKGEKYIGVIGGENQNVKDISEKLVRKLILSS